MAGVQLRRYEIHPGAMDSFLAAWRGAVVVRRQYGFAVLFAFVDEEHNEFVWAVSHEGDFADASDRYYASPERAGLPTDPKDSIAVAHVTMVRTESPD